MPNYYSEEIYSGPETIIVAMDIGTTNSAVSFAYLSPGSKPQGKMVAHWPGQAHWNGAAKIPSIVSYRDGVVVNCGEEAARDLDEHPENVAHWFKLRLHPASMSKTDEFEIPPLPTDVTVEQIYTDLMEYLMEHTRRFFIETTVNGAEIWTRVRDSIIIVLATPNGWDIREQATLRNAAIKSSLVTADTVDGLLQFVTEAEASVHYVLVNQEQEWLKRGSIFAVVDCGGSTVDTTVYRCISTNPLALSEVCPSGCVQAGGIFVDRKFGKMLESKLKGSPFSSSEYIRAMIGTFESKLKPKFDGLKETYEFKFGSFNDNNSSLGIEKGWMTLSNDDLRSVFDDLTKKIIESCGGAILNSKPKHCLLVGGFAESPYVRRLIREALDSRRIQLIIAGDFSRKAAAEGAIIGHIKQFVVARAVKATFGGCVRPVYDKRLHQERKHTVQIYPDGKKRVDGAFHMWIMKGTVLQGTFAHKLPYHVAWDAATTSKKDLIRGLGSVEIELFAWERTGTPIWCRDLQGNEIGGMRHICTLNANLSALAGGLQIRTGLRGKTFYRVDYNVCVYFGGTQLRAKLQWKEGKQLCESRVTIIENLLAV